MSKVTKAIIPVAGWGTRRLPVTKVIEKCMLPIGNRPIIDYVVRDAIAAGITDIYFVVSEDSQQLKSYYSSNEKLESYLHKSGKNEELEQIKPPKEVDFHYIVQPDDGKYGTAIPVALASSYVDEDESVVVLMGDDFVYNADGASETARLINATPEGGCGLLATHVSKDELYRYGVIELDDQQNYVRIVDQPRPEDAPSDLINISKYVLTKDVIERAVAIQPSGNGEYQLPDAINQYVSSGGSVKVVPSEGEYLDGGNLKGWLHANQVVAAQA